MADGFAWAGAGTLRRRSGQSRDWRQSGAWTGRRPTAAARRGSCAWVISVGPSPLLSKKERSPADSRITQRRSSRPSTALLPWSPSTGTGGRHPPETVVAFNRKPWSPWTGARNLQNAATVHEYDRIGNIAGKTHLVGHDDHRHALLRQPANDAQHLADHFRV